MNDGQKKRRITQPIPIRLDEDTIRRICAAAKRMGITRAGIIRFAITQQLPEIESGQITLKP